jgi:Flp pilus assembly protein TadG
MSKSPQVLKRSLLQIDRLLRDRRGATAIMLAIALSGIVGFAGLGSEVAAWYFTTRAMQNATASAAASAAASLAAAEVTSGTTQCPTSPNFCRDTGRAVAASFNFTQGVSSTTVTVNNPPATTANLPTCSSPFTSYNCYVEVVISQPQAAMLSAVVMPSGWSPTITTRAVARANRKATSTGCVLALDGVASRAANAGGTGTLTFNGCSIYSNSSASDGIYVGGSGVVSAQGAYVVGYINGTVHTDPTYGTNTGVNPTVDPYANVAVPSSSTTCNGWTPNGNNSLHLSNSTDTATLYPSTAGGTCAIPHDVRLDGGTLNLCPGVYVFNSGSNLTLTANAIVNAPPQDGPIPPATNPTMSASSCPVHTAGGGVTIVFVNSSGNPGTASITGSPTVNMVAPTSGTTSGIAIFQQRTTCTSNGNGSGGCAATLQGGSTQNINGAIYFPNNAISYSGGSSTSGYQCTQLIADTITFAGGSTFSSDCTGSGTQGIAATNGTLVM